MKGKKKINLVNQKFFGESGNTKFFWGGEVFHYKNQ